MKRKVEYNKWGSVEVTDSTFFFNRNSYTDNVYNVHHDSSVFDILLTGFEQLDGYIKKGGKYFLVFFGGAVSSFNNPPFFSGLGVQKKLGLPVLSISDPSLAINDSLNLAWYLGNENDKSLQSSLSGFIDKFSKKLGLQPILIGGSGGGFASLLVGSNLSCDCICFVWNPQINIANYHRHHVTKYIKSCYEIFFKQTELNTLKKNELLSEDIAFLLDELPSNHKTKYKDFDAGKKVLYLQNINDEHHVSNHLCSFLSLKKPLVIDENIIDYCENLTLILGDWGDGHTPPPNNIIVNMLKNLVDGKALTTRNSLESFNEPYILYNGIFTFGKDNISYRLRNNNQLEVRLVLDGHVLKYSDCTFAVYFYSGEERIQICWYQDSPFFDLPDANITAVHIFVLDRYSNKNQKLFKFKNNILHDNFTEKEPEFHVDLNKYDAQLTVSENIIFNNIWYTERFGGIPFGPMVKINWAQDPFKNRSWVWLLHQLVFIKDLLVYDKENSSKVGLQFSFDIIKSWWAHNKDVPFTSEVVWHDHGSALRLRRILDVFNHLSDANILTKDDSRFFDCLIKKHADYLADDKFYSCGNNHGLDQTITLFLAVSHLKKKIGHQNI